jgi:hypothetical protein
MKTEMKHALFPFLPILVVLVPLAGCADFQLGKTGGVVSGCVDTTSKDRCVSDPERVPQGVSPKGERAAEAGGSIPIDKPDSR